MMIGLDFSKAVACSRGLEDPATLLTPLHCTRVLPVRIDLRHAYHHSRGAETLRVWNSAVVCRLFATCEIADVFIDRLLLRLETRVCHCCFRSR